MVDSVWLVVIWRVFFGIGDVFCSCVCVLCRMLSVFDVVLRNMVLVVVSLSGFVCVIRCVLIYFLSEWMWWLNVGCVMKWFFVVCVKLCVCVSLMKFLSYFSCMVGFL